MSRPRICVLDVETFWSTTHSLSKMSPISYIMHPETEIISLACKFIENGVVGETQVIFGEDNIKNICSRIDWSGTTIVAHNGEGFDFPLVNWRLGVKPKRYLCTLAMSRPHHAKEVGGSLAKLVEHYGIGVKDQSALMNTKGRHLKDFTPDEIVAMGEYNKADVDQCWELFKRLIKVTSKDELRLIDMTIRMLVEPQFEVDRKLLVGTLADERHRKLKALVELGDMLGTDEPEEVKKVMASAAKFSELLRSRNVEVPTKISPTTGKPTPALAKTDEAFIALQNHPDPVVSCAAQVRLGVKSTLLETRIQAFLDAAAAAEGRLPIPTKYYGADTTGRRCLVADTLVTVYDSLTCTQVTKKIVDVQLTDLVWDGESFVSHDGVAFQGHSEVVSWCSVEGTEDHVVFTEAGEISLSEARARGVPIEIGANPTDDDVEAARIYVRNHKIFTSL